MLGRFFNLAGLAMSGVVLAVIAYWGSSLKDLQVENLPIVIALEGDIRKKPEAELTQNSNRELSVNSLISQRNNEEEDIKILHAPYQEKLQSDEATVSMTPKSNEVDLSKAIADALKEVLGESTVKDVGEGEDKFSILFAETKNRVEVEELYVQLLLTFKEELSDIPYEIEEIMMSGQYYYRLALHGFEDREKAIDLQMFLERNGVISEISNQ